ncbi:MAG: lysophospholipid acyltransferase family protein [Candidatus Omnitrophica bacterium]|nr:lysophospholipid acyltransferase family protein [Candidatus Omnitrophota bacterium]MBU4473340.1 lysophospholipid acyltransferase family protein [Candidatus Omnitrophota bacterium]MCG2705924.1 lysophospholipid acyltransferase family protein [Candidatus Omnitrophota bacterium]
MDSKKIRKGILRFFGWLGLSLCSLIIKLIPERWLYGFAKGMAALAYIVASKKRKIALENLAIAFAGEKTGAEIEKIARDCFTFMAKSGAEIAVLTERTSPLRERIKITGRENLDAAYSRGKGVILVSAHFGNFPLMLVRLSLEGYKPAVIMRHMRDRRAEKMLLKRRLQIGLNVIYSQPRKRCVEDSMRSLRNNELLLIPLDQNFGSGGVFVDFFGRKAATAKGPVVLARRTGATILPCFILRQKDDTHQIIFEPPLNLEEGRTPEETVIINIQKLTDIIASYIRRYPAEWGWIHRRWKSKPS